MEEEAAAIDGSREREGERYRQRGLRVSDQIEEIRVFGYKTPNKIIGVNLTEVLWMALSPFSFLIILYSLSFRATNLALASTSAHGGW